MKKSVVSLVLTLIITAITVAMNAAGAIDGGPARVAQLLLTVIYILNWATFSISAKQFGQFKKLVLVVSIATLVSSCVALFCRLTHTGFILAAVLSVCASVPFYGLRFLVDWTGVYAIAAALSAVWVAYCVWMLRKK